MVQPHRFRRHLSSWLYLHADVVHVIPWRLLMPCLLRLWVQVLKY